METKPGNYKYVRISAEEISSMKSGALRMKDPESRTFGSSKEV
jgi:hypothetical protein